MTELQGANAVWIVLLSGTAAILALTLYWGLSSSRPIRRHDPVTGRAAVPYWHTSTGIQDERGITAKTD